ncbi:MAG: hypothetical protein U1E65_15300 [Myxococcota bacterium]
MKRLSLGVLVSVGAHVVALLAFGQAAVEKPRKQAKATIRWVETKTPARPTPSPSPVAAAPAPKKAEGQLPRAAQPRAAARPEVVPAPAPEAHAAETPPRGSVGEAGVLRTAPLDLALHADASGRSSTSLPAPGDQGIGAVPGQTFGAHGDGLLPGLRPNGDGTYAYQERGFTAVIERDGTVVFDNRLPISAFAGSLVTFDVTEAIIALHGDDPYYVEKLQFLKTSWPLRSKMCSAARKESLDLAVQNLRRTLKRVWSDEARPIAVRRRVIFDLWDQCAENESDPEVARAATMARATVLGFIHEVAPSSSPERYPEEELAELNRQRISRAEFRPYQR